MVVPTYKVAKPQDPDKGKDKTAMMSPTEIKEYFQKASKSVDNKKGHIYRGLQNFSKIIKTLQDCNLDISVDLYSDPHNEAYKDTKKALAHNKLDVAGYGFIYFGKTPYLFSIIHRDNGENADKIVINKYQDGNHYRAISLDLTDEDDLKMLQEHLIEKCAINEQLVKKNDIENVFNKPSTDKTPPIRTAISEVKKPGRKR
jgi:hypothetical protein